MATLTCPNCAREVSAEAERCPNCDQRLDGMGVEGPPPPPAPRPEASDEAADIRVGGRESLDHEPEEPPERESDRAGDRTDADPAHVPPVEVSPADTRPTDTQPTDTTARPSGGFQWSAILGGFLTFFVAGMVLQLFLPPTFASIATLALGLVVAYRMARDRKMLHAVLAFLAYYLVSIALGILLGVGAGAGGGAGGVAGP